MPGRRHRLAQRRKAVGLSQERLAEKLGVDRSTVVRWERADTDPQPWHRPRLAAALKVSIEDLAELLADVEPLSSPDERLGYVLRNPRSVDLVAVAHLRQEVQRLDEQYEHLPSTLLVADAGRLYGQAIFLQEQAASGPVRRELSAAVVESVTLVGQLVWDRLAAARPRRRYSLLRSRGRHRLASSRCRRRSQRPPAQELHRPLRRPRPDRRTCSRPSRRGHQPAR
jgi:transcriptional regulator with XRE-family HTH domain